MQSDIYSLGCILLDMITCDTLTVRDYLEKKDFCQNELFKQDEETLQLRICARHDASTLSETLGNLQKVSH